MRRWLPCQLASKGTLCRGSKMNRSWVLVESALHRKNLRLGSHTLNTNAGMAFETCSRALQKVVKWWMQPAWRCPTFERIDTQSVLPTMILGINSVAPAPGASRRADIPTPGALRGPLPHCRAFDLFECSQTDAAKGDPLAWQPRVLFRTPS